MITDRTNRFDLLRPDAMPEHRQIALKWWLKRYYRNDWMRGQDGWLEAMCLIASSRVDPSFCRPRRILYCSHKGMLCERPDDCRRCALDRRIEPAQAEYGQVFEHANYWYAVVAGSEADPNTAGLKYGPRKQPRGTWLPYRGRRHGSDITTWPEHAAVFKDMATLPFDQCEFLVRVGFGGALCHVEPHVSFYSGQTDDCWSGIAHRVLPHGNILINSPEPIDFEVGKAILEAYDAFFRHVRPCPAYPDLWIDRILSQAGLNSWLGYILKSWPIDEWYYKALTFNGCPRSSLNILFDTVVFENLHYLTGKNYFSANLRSPRKYGNLYQRTERPPYIGINPPMKLTNRQITLWLNHERYAAMHPDWESSIFRILEKRDRRKGRRARLDKDDLDEAA